MSEAANPKSLGATEFVILVASIQMLVAFAIDAMLPALPAIGDDLGVVTENHRQLVITFFMIGFGVSQFFAGTLSDRFGRRTPILIAIAGYFTMSLLASASGSFEMLLIARMLQGAAAAGARVVSTAVVRDWFAGREMARVMSLTSVIFMAAPILAPTIGAMILHIGPWRWIFDFLALFSAVVWIWVAMRLPESWPRTKRLPINWVQFRASAAMVLGDRASVGYTIAVTGFTCALMGYLVSVQQVFEHIYGQADLLPIGFAVMAIGLAGASFVNARIVRRYGMRTIGHAGLIWFIAWAAINLAVGFWGKGDVWSFVVLQTLMIIGFGFAVGNFNAMAMENMGSVAGTASSLQGSFNTLMGALVGAYIGQHFDGTTVPLYIGSLVCGVVSLLAVLWTERGKLFVAQHAAPDQA